MKDMMKKEFDGSEAAIARAIKAGAIATATKCPACGNENDLLKSGGQPIGAMARWLIANGYDVYFCLSCGHLFATKSN